MLSIHEIRDLTGGDSTASATFIGAEVTTSLQGSLDEHSFDMATKSINPPGTEFVHENVTDVCPEILRERGASAADTPMDEGLLVTMDGEGTVTSRSEKGPLRATPRFQLGSDICDAPLRSTPVMQAALGPSETELLRERAPQSELVRESTPEVASSIPAGVAVGAFRAAPSAKKNGGLYPVAIWGISLVLVFMLGMSFGGRSDSSARTRAAVAPVQSSAPLSPGIRTETPSAMFDLSTPAGANPVDEILRSPPGERSRADAVALGRHWSRERFEALRTLCDSIRADPRKLEEATAVSSVLRFAADPATSRAILETLAEVGTFRSLDLLYEIWIGPKERTDTTQLAEALLLSKDCRPKVSSALALCLELRDKPTRCEDVDRLVKTALHAGDRRAAMLLVNLGSRRNCGPSGDMDCVKCLDAPKDMRRSVHASVARPDPIKQQNGSP
jgi:hypothetical protein